MGFWPLVNSLPSGQETFNSFVDPDQEWIFLICFFVVAIIVMALFEKKD